MSSTPDFTKQAQDMMETAQKMARPEQAQELVKQGIERTKEACDKAASTIGSAAKEYENLVATAQTGTQKLSEKVMENFKANSDAVFDYANALADCSSPAEAMEVQSKFMQKQIDLLNRQTKEFFELSNEVTTSVVEKAADAAKRSSS